MCPGSFVFSFKLRMADVSTNGIIFSTTGQNTSVVGTSLRIKDSKLVASVRTISRIWEASVPAASLVDESLVQMKWSYIGELTLNVTGTVETVPYTVVSPIPVANEDLKDIVEFGEVGLTTGSVNFSITEYEDMQAKRIALAGICMSQNYT